MNILKSFLTQYGLTVAYAVLTAVAGVIGTQIKRLYEKVCTDETKRTVAHICVGAVEQLYGALHGAEKKQKAKEAIFAMLAEKCITVTPLELDMLIESVVAELNGKLTEHTA